MEAIPDVRWFEARIAPIENLDDGKPRVLIVSRDITDRKQAEEALRLSEEKFRQIFEEGPIGMHLIDPSFRILSALTVHEDPDLVSEAFRVGASGFLLKSSAASELFQAIQEVVRGRAYVTPLVTRGMVLVDSTSAGWV